VRHPAKSPAADGARVIPAAKAGRAGQGRGTGGGNLVESLKLSMNWLAKLNFFPGGTLHLKPGAENAANSITLHRRLLPGLTVGPVLQPPRKIRSEQTRRRGEAAGV